MGQYGITLPFLVGALARLRHEEPSVENIRGLLQEIVANPFPGYVTEVRWCAQVDAPVFSISRLNNSGQMPFKSHLANSRGEVSLGFSQDLQSMFGLNCNGSSDCLEKLVVHAASPVESGRFSRVRNPANGEMEFGDFLPNEVRYIEEACALAAN